MACYLKVTPPGVSYAVKRLKQQGYVTSDEAGILFLTAKGREIAENT